MKKVLMRFYKGVHDSAMIQLLVLFGIFLILAGAIVFALEVGKNNQYESFFDGLWWAVITFSTTGYGDKVPLTIAGKTVAIVSIFFGIGASSALSGALASLFVDRNTRSRRGLMDFRKLKNHYIICGWKSQMEEILHEILLTDPALTSDMLLMISNVGSEKIEELKEQENLKELRFVRGDYFSEASLVRANVMTAKKVLILADTFDSNAVSEVDSKTVMTVLTIKSMSKDTYTCAELLDRKYESYLKQAMCDEILFSRDISRRMLATTTVTSGMSHIINSLLTPDQSSSRLKTLEIPDSYVGKSYGEFMEGFMNPSTQVVLGILENTGSPNRIKLEALRQAQKTSDISALVANLQGVKELSINNPVFIPGGDYVIQKYSKAIVLEKVAVN